MTEEDAKQRWCPFARVIPGKLSAGIMHAAAPGVTAHNRVQEIEATEPTWHRAMNCIGSACMAWRTTETSCGRPYGTDGYCGLAGKP